MLRVDVCIEAVFDTLPLVERAKRVRDAGFDALEFWFYDLDTVTKETKRDIDELGRFCAENKMRINNAVVNSPDAGIGGSLVDPGDRDRYLARLKETIAVCRGIDCHAAITCTGNCRIGVPVENQRAAIIDTLRAAAEICEESGFTLFLESLNTIVDHKGYFLDSADEAAEIIHAVGSSRVKLLFDIYHMQVMAGNVIARIQRLMDAIGHFHAAGVPGRHELDSGELNYPNILKAIEQSGYSGLVGLEYWPEEDHAESLKRMRRLTA